jgi:catechol 2,3-dioxygenase-like lactoylglutathione lyase family enzyme
MSHTLDLAASQPLARRRERAREGVCQAIFTRREVTVLGSSDVIAFAAAADLRRARVFYEQTLGLLMVEQNDFACVFDANGTMLRITAVPEVSRTGYTVLGWRVPDIAAAVRGLTARGVVFMRYDGMDQDDIGVWTTPGGEKVAWFADPDGNVLSLTQFR